MKWNTRNRQPSSSRQTRPEAGQIYLEAQVLQSRARQALMLYIGQVVIAGTARLVRQLYAACAFLRPGMRSPSRSQACCTR